MGFGILTFLRDQVFGYKSYLSPEPETSNFTTLHAIAAQKGGEECMSRNRGAMVHVRVEGLGIRVLSETRTVIDKLSETRF